MGIAGSGRFALAAVVVIAAAAASAGCAGGARFAYRPGPPEERGVKLPFKVAVLPFTDATENFTRRASASKAHFRVFNLAKGSFGDVMEPLPPEYWAKMFADDLQASGMFRSARFAYSQKELVDEQYVIDGAVERAYVAGYWGEPSDFTVRLRLSERPGGRVVGEQVFSRTWFRGNPGEECRMSPSCVAERFHERVNESLRELFAQARVWLVGAVSQATGEGAAAQPAGVAPLPPASEPASVGETIERILKEN